MISIKYLIKPISKIRSNKQCLPYSEKKCIVYTAQHAPSNLLTGPIYNLYGIFAQDRPEIKERPGKVGGQNRFKNRSHLNREIVKI